MTEAIDPDGLWEASRKAIAESLHPRNTLAIRLAGATAYQLSEIANALYCDGEPLLGDIGSGIERIAETGEKSK